MDLSQIAGFNKGVLRPTQTTVRHGPVLGQPPVQDPTTIKPVDDEDKTEYYDDPKILRSKVSRLAKLIMDSKHCVVYTGAGISTSAKLPDYRGPQGIWTLKDQGFVPRVDLTIEQARPTLCHMAIAALVSAGFVKHVVSTNVDGLHMRSGVPRPKLSELHGNCYLEKCSKCQTEYFRSYDVTERREGETAGHFTGRLCSDERCQGKLIDSIINFGESLPEAELTNAERSSQKADLALVLGTSLRVKPASKLPDHALANGGNLVICNLQKTPSDGKAQLRIQAQTDDLAFLLCQELGVKIPMTTPEGHALSPYQDNIDEKYAAKVAEVKEAKALALAQHPISRTKANELKYSVLKAQGQTLLLDSPHQINRKLVYFQECSDSTFTIATKCNKIIIEKCQNCTFHFKDSILTSTVELIDNTNVNVNINQHVLTLSADNCKQGRINFASEEFFQILVVALCDDLTIAVGTIAPYTIVAKDLPAAPTHNHVGIPTVPQHMLQILNANLICEAVIRQGGGYATTGRQKAIQDQKLERNLQILTAQMRQTFSFDGKKAHAAPSDKPQ